MKIAYICDGNACGGDICSTECNHTFDVEHALHKDSLDSCRFQAVRDEGGNIIAFEEIAREYKYNNPKEVTIWGLGGNKYELDKGCTMVLYNENENGDEYDSVYIHLDQKNIKSLIRCLQEYVKDEPLIISVDLANGRELEVSADDMIEEDVIRERFALKPKAYERSICCMNCDHSFYPSQWDADETPELHCGLTGDIVADDQYCTKFE